MVNVAVKEGWAGGPWLSAQFTKALQEAGFNLTDVAHADCIIAHSTACYDLGAKTPAQLLILIDPPYWPGKSILTRMLEKKKSDNRQARQNHGWSYMFKKSFWELVYILQKPNYTLLALKHNGQLDFLKDLSQKPIYLVRNEKDYFCSPEIQVAAHGHPNIRYITLPGEHDDYYTNPQPYIALLPKEL